MFKIVATALALSSALIIAATCAKAQEVTAETTTYRDALKSCGLKWRMSDERKAVVKGEGAQAWQVYRKACVLESGFKSKKG